MGFGMVAMLPKKNGSSTIDLCVIDRGGAVAAICSLLVSALKTDGAVRFYPDNLIIDRYSCNDVKAINYL
jgi:hypothetical protein